MVIRGTTSGKCYRLLPEKENTDFLVENKKCPSAHFWVFTPSVEETFDDLSSSFSFFGNFGFEKKTESSIPHSKEF